MGYVADKIRANTARRNGDKRYNPRLPAGFARSNGLASNFIGQWRKLADGTRFEIIEFTDPRFGPCVHVKFDRGGDDATGRRWAAEYKLKLSDAVDIFAGATSFDQFLTGLDRLDAGYMP